MTYPKGFKSYVLIFNLMLLSFSSFAVHLSSASMVWSDNFDDRDLTEWKISGASYAGRNLVELIVAPGNFSVVDGTLRETSAPKMMGYSYIARPNTVTKGTWSFDVFFFRRGYV